MKSALRLQWEVSKHQMERMELLQMWFQQNGVICHAAAEIIIFLVKNFAVRCQMAGQVLQI